LQDWVIEREFRRVPRIADSEGRGGATKRYEVNSDPDRLGQFGITLRQLQDAVVNANHNVGGDFVQGRVMLNVRGVGLFGGGEDPLAQVRGMKDADQAAARLREEEDKRLREIRGIVITSVNNRDVLLEDVVDGGRLAPDVRLGARGVVVGARRQGDVALGEGPAWRDEERVEGVVFLRRGEDAEAALRDVRARVEQLNAGDVLLPGVRIEPLVERGGRPEDCFWMLAEFPRNIAPERLAQDLRELRALLGRQAEVAAVLTETDGPDAAAPQPGSAAVFVRLKPPGAGARGPGQLVKDMSDEVSQKFPGVTLTPANGPPDNFALAFEVMPGEVLLKLFGRDLDELQQVVARVAEALRRAQGVEDVRPVDGSGATHLEWRVDLQKCKRWGVSADDVIAVTQAALDGKAVSTMIEGEKQFDITVRWRTAGVTSILDLPVDVVNNRLAPAAGAGPNAAAPRIRLRDLVSPLGKDGAPDPEGEFERAGVTAVYRENGRRCVAVRFRLHDTALDRVRDGVAPLIPASCRAEWVAK
jgi:Cu/Ag efflux pump CusA